MNRPKWRNCPKFQKTSEFLFFNPGSDKFTMDSQDKIIYDVSDCRGSDPCLKGDAHMSAAAKDGIRLPASKETPQFANCT